MGTNSRVRDLVMTAPDDVRVGESPRAPADTASVLSLTGISVRFGGIRALTDVSLNIERGQVCGLIGPNGAGKTTLFDVISGVRRPDAGSVVLDGRDVTGTSSITRARMGLRRTFQRVQTFGWLSVEDNLLAAIEWEGGGGGILADMVALPARRRREKMRRQRVDEAIERCGLASVRHDPAGSLPIGVARMVEVARAVIARPTLLILDEPTSGLDNRERDRLGEMLGDGSIGEDCAVLLVEHDIGFVMEHSGNIYVLNLGEVLAVGAPDEIKANSAVKAAYLGG